MPRKIDYSRLSETGAKLVRARESVGLDRTRAAQKLGIGYAALFDLERGLALASLDRLFVIAEAWGVDPSDLDSRLASSQAQHDPQNKIPSGTNEQELLETLLETLLESIKTDGVKKVIAKLSSRPAYARPVGPEIELPLDGANEN